MKPSRFQIPLREAYAIDRGEIAPGRVRKVTLMPDGTLSRIELNPETYRRKQARAWKAKT